MKQTIFILILILLLVGCVTSSPIKTYEVIKVGTWDDSLIGRCETRNNTTMRCFDCLEDAYVVCKYQQYINGYYACEC